MKRYFDVGRHYDSITEGWRYIFGDNFHFGYFKTPEDNLDKATYNLIDDLASLCKLGPGTKILDAGCGIGTPATYLHEKFGSDITGISTSRKGVDLANRRIQDGKYKAKIRFIVSDMNTTGFPDKSFDVIWVMESSHLIKDKGSLMDEFYRLLKPGGNILLSDIMLKKEISLIIRLNNFFKLMNLLKAFGRGRLETSEHYTCLFRNSGFKNIFSRDIGSEAEETLTWWGNNIIKNKSDLIKVMEERRIKRFENAIDALRYFFREGFFCYCLFKAEK